MEEVIVPTYRLLRDEENRFTNGKEGTQASYDKLMRILVERGSTYDEFIFSL